LISEITYPVVQRESISLCPHGRRNRGVWGTMSPTFGTSGVQGGGGPMKMILASTADSPYSVLYK